MQTAKFIVIEGIEGVGKSTASAYLQQYLTQTGIDFIATREPGGTDIAEQIRHLLLTKNPEKMAELTELLLMFAGRAQHLAQVILPALAAGKWVLCDRFTDATYAYQGGGRGVNNQLIADLEQLVQGDLRPDHVLLLDAPMATCLARIQQRGELDRFENEKTLFFERVKAKYLERAEADPARYTVIDAGQPLAVVEQQLVASMTTLIEESGTA